MKYWSTCRCAECLKIHFSFGEKASDFRVRPILGELLYMLRSSDPYFSEGAVVPHYIYILKKTRVRPFSATTFHEVYTAGWIAVLTGLWFDSKLRKCSEELFVSFFGRHEGKLETFAKICVAASLETLREDLTVRVCDKQAALKLLSEISRTAPEVGHPIMFIISAIR